MSQSRTFLVLAALDATPMTALILCAAIVDIRFMALPWLRKKFNHV